MGEEPSVSVRIPWVVRLIDIDRPAGPYSSCRRINANRLGSDTPIYRAISCGSQSYFDLKVCLFLSSYVGPAESPKEALNSSRNIAVKALIGGVFLVQTAGVASRYLLNISPAALHPFAPLFAILLYSTATAVGYDGARSKNVLDRVDALSNEEINGSPLFEIFSGKSKRKALSAVFGCLIIGLMVGLSTSPIAGMSTAGSIATLLALGIQLYPDES